MRFTNSSFKNLRTLRISELELKCLPTQVFYNNQNLSTLKIRKCAVLRELPDGLETLNSLEELTIEECANLKSIGNPRKYQGFLRKLEIVGCGELLEFPCQILESSASKIETLILEELRSLKNLPMLIDCLAKSSPRLKVLKITGVPNFVASATTGSWSLGRLKELRIDVSVEWSRETVDGILQGCCKSLTDLTLKGVENWEWVPQSIQHLTALSKLKLEKTGVEELPQWLGNLSSVRILILADCNRLRCLPSLAARLTKLQLLEIDDCPELHLDSEWCNLPNLKISHDQLPLAARISMDLHRLSMELHTLFGS